MSWTIFSFLQNKKYFVQTDGRGISVNLYLNLWQKNHSIIRRWLLSTKLFSHHSPALSVFFSRMFQNSSPNSNHFLVKLSGRTGLCKSYYRSFWFGLHQTSYFSILDLTNKFWIDLLILMQNTFSVYLRKWTLWADFMIHLLEQNTKT